jgi:hypothetical protein
VNIDIVHPDNRVEYEYWYSTVFDQEPWVLYDMSLYQKALGSNALFTPRILTYSCPYCPESFKTKHCLVDGKYCPFFAKDTTPHEAENLPNGFLLMESVRQKCVYEIVSNEQQGKNATFDKWFHYSVEFLDHCVKNQDFSEECANLYLKKA